MYKILKWCSTIFHICLLVTTSTSELKLHLYSEALPSEMWFSFFFPSVHHYRQPATALPSGDLGFIFFFLDPLLIYLGKGLLETKATRTKSSFCCKILQFFKEYSENVNDRTKTKENKIQTNNDLVIFTNPDVIM